MYEEYYSNQGGNGMAIFSGYPGQRGHGLGSMLSGFFRSAMPMIQRGLATFGKQALKTGAQIVGDFASGANLRDSAEMRGREAIKTLADKASHALSQEGSGARRRKRKSSKPLKLKRQTKRAKKRRVSRFNPNSVFH
jgi:hypothetical protein